MAKKTENKAIKEKLKKAKNAIFKKEVSFPLKAKFSFFTGLLLFVIMVIITIFIYNWVSVALEKEVKERGLAVAKNIANNAADPLIKNDDLALAIFTKEAVQSPAKEEAVEEDMLHFTYDEIKNIINPAAAGSVHIKNEGIYGAEIIKQNGIIASSNDVGKTGNKYVPPGGIRLLKPGEDELVQDYVVNSKHYYDIAVAVSSVLNNQKYSIGEVHLTISHSIISKAVTGAVVRIGFIVIVALFLGIIVTIMLVSFMVKPISYLVEGVHAIGEGNYDVKINLKTSDELGLLTDIFNDTAKSLKEKELLKGAFSTYVSSEVMNEVLKDPKKLSLSGKRVKATMLFTDIRGFTSMSEVLEPEQVVAVINEYLTIQTERVFENKGVLDKFIGDSIMAVFGIPVPMHDDALRAVITAMEIRESVKGLNEIRAKADKQTVGIGIGINTGEVVSGNVGSPQKMDYTVIGDNVNLASGLRLTRLQARYM